MKLKDKVVEALKEDAESVSGFLSGFSTLDLHFHDSFVAIDGEIEVGHVNTRKSPTSCSKPSTSIPMTNTRNRNS